MDFEYFSDSIRFYDVADLIVFALCNPEFSATCGLYINQIAQYPRHLRKADRYFGSADGINDSV
jgi:hypothetical protein